MGRRARSPAPAGATPRPDPAAARRSVPARAGAAISPPRPLSGTAVRAGPITAPSEPLQPRMGDLSDICGRAYPPAMGASARPAAFVQNCDSRRPGRRATHRGPIPPGRFVRYLQKVAPPAIAATARPAAFVQNCDSRRPSRRVDRPGPASPRPFVRFLRALPLRPPA